MTDEYQMANKETAAHFRKWFQSEHGRFAWPTDACGYNQSVRFSQYKNENLKGQDIIEFCLAYADRIENEPDTLCKCIHPNVKVTFMCYCCDEPSCKFHGLNSDGSAFEV
jgi:hypothetical protein